MTAQKQWYDDDGITFHSEHKVQFSQSDSNKRMSLYDLLRVSSDMAVEDYAQRGMDRDTLTQHGYAILVSRTAFRFHRMPKENENYVFTTYEEKAEPLQLVRAYEFTTPEGQPLITGISSWLLVDPVLHRIIPTKKFDMRKPVESQKEHDCLKYGKIQIPEDLEKWDERIIKYSDIDGNNHVNNARYGAFVADSIPADFRTTTFTDFRLNYAKEAKLGQKLEIFGKINESEKKLTIVGKTEEGVSFESELFYS
ncbi:acyl-[acyl-carrier-protein] thioesterase [Treponema ruminis]|uniref:Acyl-ACP thioesterase n=1 Tax=Treponema ruminis TaxID=744515 RepID=A0A7W8G8P7_9SPIR|nr:acyl-ACP thioesterase domain-containing protein [Treponema ruminis]MBB5225928.1 acyl-ACP thioesterase [Treponema ruminis]QSI03160.1 acyl-[acyl-carrier-protein] thioesterase [Treponema ruminis]